jgi:phosphatidylcholine synthase
MATAGARAAAAAVHVFTATGAVLALLMVHFSYQHRVETVLWLFLVAMVIDGTDGMLARRFHVKTVLPGFDGALLDNIVDYMTYALAPMALLWANGYLPDGAAGGVVASIPLLASTYQFCRSDAKTDDHFFLGFPSYWNIVAFYVVVWELSTVGTTALLLALSVLVFVPIKYLYPSRTERLWYVNMTLSVLWLALWALITASLPDAPSVLVGLSLVYVAYYIAVSLWLTFSPASAHPQARKSAAQASQT